MEFEDTAKRIGNIRQPEQLEEKPVASYNPSEGMDSLEEAQEQILLLQHTIQELKQEKEELLRTITGLKDCLKDIQCIQKTQMDTIKNIMELIAERDNEKKRLTDKAEKLMKLIQLIREGE